MNTINKHNWIYALGFIVMLAVSSFASWDNFTSSSQGGAIAIWNSFVVFVLYMLIARLLYYGSKRITIDQKETFKENAIQEKRSIFHLMEYNDYFRRFIITLFHLIPFYLPFLIFLTNIELVHKGILFFFSIITYLLVEFYYILKRVLIYTRRIIRNFKNSYVALSVFILSIVLFFVVAFFVVVSLLIFYANNLFGQDLSLSFISMLKISWAPVFLGLGLIVLIVSTRGGWKLLMDFTKELTDKQNNK